VINGLTNEHHPCQLLADVYTYGEHRGAIEGRTVAWIGDGNNMCNTWIEAATLLGFDLRVATPRDYAAHRLLADVRPTRPRDELARVGELWTSQLLQPANLTPIQPQLGQASVLLVNRETPSELVFSGLAPLVASGAALTRPRW
jgi:hypothetical protein